MAVAGDAIADKTTATENALARSFDIALPPGLHAEDTKRRNFNQSA
jgi:hypothetical protein